MPTTPEQVIADHFPEYITRTCLCTEPLEGVHTWARHVVEKLGEAGYFMTRRPM